MDDDLDLLRDLPRHRPSDTLRREVRVAALAALSQAPAPWWKLSWRQLAIQLTLATASAAYLIMAAGHTPILR